MGVHVSTNVHLLGIDEPGLHCQSGRVVLSECTFAHQPQHGFLQLQTPGWYCFRARRFKQCRRALQTSQPRVSTPHFFCSKP